MNMDDRSIRATADPAETYTSKRGSAVCDATRATKGGAVRCTTDAITVASSVTLPEIDMYFLGGECDRFGTCATRVGWMSEGGYKYSGRITLRMPISLHRELAHAAVEQKVSMNQLVCIALAGALERRHNDPARPYSGTKGQSAPVGSDFDAIMRSMGYDDPDD